jgi:hypothetical protein
MPDESITVTAKLPPHTPEKYTIVVSAWNAPSITLDPGAATHTAASVTRKID